MDLNRVMIIGRLTRDPELRSLATGRSVSSFSVATGRAWTDANGQKQKQTEFHNVVAWAKLAEIASQYLRKGAKVYVEGRLQTRDWTAQDGTKRTRTEIVAENLIMLDAKGAVNSGTDAAPSFQDMNNGSQNDEVIEEEIKIEDIPF